MTVPRRLAALRTFLTEQGVDAIVVPSSDPHGGEYVAAHWRTRAWLSGFDGSAGTLVVARDRAALWTDARYLLRATDELAGSGIELRVAPKPWAPGIAAWLAEAVGGAGTVGYDAAVSVDADLAGLERALGGGIALRAVADPADALRGDRPPLPTAPLERLGVELAGESRASKLDRLRARLSDAGAHAQLVAALDDVAWTLNVRGGDVAFNRVALAYLVVTPSRALLCIDPAKVGAALRRELEADGVTLRRYEEVVDVLAALPAGTSVLLDPDRTGRRLVDAIPRSCALRRSTSIPTELKAIKNPTELAGLRDAHRRDGAALVTLLHALATRAAGDGWTEVSTVARLEAIRARDAAYRGPSFSTIVGYRSNSAVGHYQPSPESTIELGADGVLLIDAGAHDRGGTTDVTRTVTLGSPSAAERLAYTTVLRSLIRLSTATFPEGTSGMKLDALAREPLWRRGWNCRHGIGHGIGHVLHVHEGPQRFAPDATVGFVPGMTTTCEPGVYFAGRFGVRLENVLLSVPHAATEFGPFCAFETLTLCPFDRSLIDVDLLEADERSWVDAYHARVRSVLGPALEGGVRDWLATATRPL